jgi:hypothetical protein
MAKVAKLVAISLLTRVIVDENATEEEILGKAVPKFMEKVNEEIGEHLEYIVDDEECPYGTFDEEVVVFYQPELDDLGDIKGHPGESIFSFEVWRSKENLLKNCPNCTPIEYKKGDIENPSFMD